MRRTFGYIALELGLVLIVLSPLLRWYAYPRVAKAPNDVSDRTVNVGTGSYFDPQTLSLVNDVQLQNITIAKGDPGRSTHEVSVITITGQTVAVQSGAKLDYTYDVYAMDRVTGYAVHCCGELPRHEGLTLKFPFDTHRRTYLFYDSTAHKAFPAKYIRTETVAGLETFVFVSKVPQTRIGLIGFPGKLGGHPDLPSVATLRYYSATTTLWVEPFTGAVVKASQTARQWLTDTAGLFLTDISDTNFTNSQADIEDTASQITTKYSQLKLVRDILPIGGPILGAILVLMGLLLLFGRPRSRATSRATTAGTRPMEAGV